MDELLETMTGAVKNVATAQITYAARNSDFDGFAINEGDYLSLLDGKLFLSVEGFMVCPPEMMPSAPRSRNTSASPSPAQTARICHQRGRLPIPAGREAVRHQSGYFRYAGKAGGKGR